MKVSIIVPVYNTERYLPKCLDSLLNQTLDETEIIVVNDSSPDDSQKIIADYQNRYPQIKGFSKENSGVGDARNFGLSRATGEFIFFADSDDFVAPDALEKLYATAKREQSDVVVCGYNVFDENGRDIGYRSSLNTSAGDDLKLQVMLEDSAVWNKLYRRDLLTENNLRFRSRVWYEDIDFQIGVLLNCRSISYVGEGLYNYLVRQGSIMNNSDIRKNTDILKAFDQIAAYCDNGKGEISFYDEIEFLAIRHIYVTPTVRILLADGPKETKDEVLKELRGYLISHFPNYRKNKYLRILPTGEKTVYHLLNLKLNFLVKLLFRFKRAVL